MQSQQGTTKDETNGAAAGQSAETTQAPAQTMLSHSERFTNQVMREFNGNITGGLQITDYQRQLIQGYFIGVDRALKTTEDGREAKNKKNTNHKFDNALPCVWGNVNLVDLALDVVHYARMGLDMMQDNHLFPIPFHNEKTKKYDVALMPGYNGIQFIAEKYAIDKPTAVTVELVYSSDTFKAIKKCANNKVESYEFSVNNPFERGEVIGGFGYIEYAEPTKNKLIFMSKRDIEKRKPSYAAAEFWGGKKTKAKWENGVKVGETEETVEGWFEEMCLKTLKREVYSSKHMPRDPKKIDDNYQYMRLQELRLAERASQAEIYDQANTIIIDAVEIPDNEQDAGEYMPPPNEPAAQQNSSAPPTESANGPNF